MICPNSLCKKEIPDDSLFCDQCGSELLKCQQCGRISCKSFCGFCGIQTISLSQLVEAKDEEVIDSDEEIREEGVKEDEIKNKTYFEEDSGTVIIEEEKTSSLELFHKDGWSIKPLNNNVLGRSCGEFADKLSFFPVISHRHALITKEDDNWFITDLNSTNKTYLNDKRLNPDEKILLSNNDVLVLANVTFIVRIQ